MNRRDFLFKSGAALSLGLMARGSLSAQASVGRGNRLPSNLGVAYDELTSA